MTANTNKHVMLVVGLAILINLMTSLTYSDENEDKAFNFTDVSSSAGIVSGISGAHGVYVADVNGDGYDDIYVTNCGDSGTPDLLYINQKNGTFNENAYNRGVYDYNSNGCSHGSVFADFDRDGDFDLVNGNTGERNRYYRNNGSGFFTNATNSSGLLNYPGETRSIIAAYLNGDSKLDLFNVNYGYSSLQYNELYFYSGGAFSFIGQFISPGVRNNLYNLDYELEQGMASGDIDNDGDVDIYICRRGNPNQLYINDGTGYFTEEASIRGVAQAGYGDGAVLGDIDTDGDLDLIIAGTGNSTLRIYRNTGTGHFQDITSLSSVVGYSYMATLGDLDLDGDLDLVVSRYVWDQANPSHNKNSYYKNDGNGVFTYAGTFFSTQWDDWDVRSCALIDYDNDGDLDVMFVLNNGSAKLFRNNVNKQSWIKVKLAYQGAAGGFGTKLSFIDPLSFGGRSLRAYREATGTQGYLSQNSPLVHAGFALVGDYNIDVQFPDGTVWHFLNIHTGQTLDISNLPATLETPQLNSPSYDVPTKSLTLSWSQDDPSSIRNYFEIWKDTNNDGSWDLLTTTPNTNYVDAAVNEELTYAYKIRSVDSFSRASEFSNGEVITIPSVPTIAGVGWLILLICCSVFLIRNKKMALFEE